MTLNQLRYFQAVCRQGGVNKAAEFLMISQPSVSSAIQELEKELEVALFMRYHKHLILTKEGSEFLKYTDEILQSVERTLLNMKALGTKKTLIFGVPPMLSSLVTPVLHQKYKETSPDFDLKIVEGGREELLKMVEENQINIALLPFEKSVEAKFCFEHIANVQNICCFHKSHPFATRKSVSPEDLKEEPLVLFKSSFFQTQRILDRFQERHITPNVLLSTVQVSTLESMLSKGLGVGFVYEFILERCPDLMGIPLNPPMFTSVGLVWKKDDFAFVPIQKFLKFVKQIKEVF